MTYVIFKIEHQLLKEQLIHSSVLLTLRGPKLQTITVNVCQHSQVREIGEDFDKDGRLLRLIRCQGCGLLLREYISMP